MSTPSKSVEENKSYGQILKSSSIIGGATGINYIIGLVRTKAVAVLLGPGGIGLMGMFTSITWLMYTISQLGINQSGVREVAEANGTDDPSRVARVVKTLRRACWFCGSIGWLLTVLLAWPIAEWTLGSKEHMWSVAVLGSTVLLTSITGSHTALLLGMRRIGDLAKVQVFASVVTTVVAVGLYYWLGESGIVPVLIITALLQLYYTWRYSSAIQIDDVPQEWDETLQSSKRLIGLGVALMYGTLLAALAGLAIRSCIVRYLGLDANGIYQAALALSALCAGFIINAMGTDFYPRLTAVCGDDPAIGRLVNEQIEVGVLLALPGILGTLGFSPLLMQIFYSSKFLYGADLLPWFALGVFGQVITFPLEFIQRAKSRSKWIFISQTNLHFWLLLLTFVLVQSHGLLATSWAFAAATYIHGVAAYLIARKLSGFKLQANTRRMLFVLGIFIAASFTAQAVLHGFVALVVGGIITLMGSVFAVRRLVSFLDPNHRILRVVSRIPLVSNLCGLRRPSMG